jgi:hypothetical protein
MLFFLTTILIVLTHVRKFRNFILGSGRNSVAGIQQGLLPKQIHVPVHERMIYFHGAAFKKANDFAQPVFNQYG